MFPEMRRSERQLNDADSLEILKTGEYGVLATVSEDGWPYALPVNYVYQDGAIYFHGALAGHKVANIQHDARVSFCVVADSQVLKEELTTQYASVILFGVAQFLEGQENLQALRWLYQRFIADLTPEADADLQNQPARTLAVKIKIEHMTGKARKS